MKFAGCNLSQLSDLFCTVENIRAGKYSSFIFNANAETKENVCS